MIAIFPEIAASAATGDVESLAVLVRRYFGGEQTFAPKPAIQSLIKTSGLTLRRTALPMHGALLAKDERGAFTIVVVLPEEREPLAERFLLAHLFGHYLLDVQPLIARGDWQVSGFQEIVHPLDRYTMVSEDRHLDVRAVKIEKRADQFAAALLLPRGMLRKAMAKLQSPAQVAAFFGVTSACLARRLQELDGHADSPVDFFDAEGQIGRSPEVEEPRDPAEGVVRAGLNSPADGSMPRSYAASTYGHTEKSTRRSPPPAVAASTPARAAPSPTPPRAAAGSAPLSPAPSLPTPAPAAASPSAAAAAASPAPRTGGPAGMERLRELARRLDKGPKAKV